MRIISVLLLLTPFIVCAQDNDIGVKFRYKGFIDSYHAVRSNGDWDYMSSRTRTRFESGLEKGNTSGYMSLNAVYNPIVKGQSGLFLREAYMEHSNNGWGVKVGRQIVTWGIADGVQVTDIISPMDYSEFLAQDYDDIRIPVNAIRLCYSNMYLKAEGIFVPTPEFYIMPTERENPWSISLNGMYCQLNNNIPERKFANSEYGGRVSAYLNNIDFSLCALRTWNKMPAFRLNGVTPEKMIDIDAYYDPMTMVGADLSTSLGKFVLRAEVAEYFNALVSTKNFATDPVHKNQTSALVGLDWYPGNDWTIMIQYNHIYTADYNDVLSDYEHTGLATMNISKALLRNTLKMGAFGRFDCANDGAFFIRFSADYHLTDEIALVLGYDWFNAERGMFAYYKDNSELWFKAKYSF